MSDQDTIRGVLLAALDTADWEAEHLTGLQLARRLGALYRAACDRLQALGYEPQAAKVERDALASGEELSRLAEQLAAVEADNARLREALRRVVVTDDDGAALALLHEEVAALEGENARLREALRRAGSAAPLSGVSVTDDDGEV